MKIKPYVRQKDVVVQNTKDEILVYDLKENKAFCLNETSKLIWELCNGKHSVAEITDELAKHFSKPVSEDIVYLAISQFEKDGLLNNESNKFANHFAGMSRREVIRKVGFASVIALPLISSVVAPKSADAASNCLAPNTPITESPPGRANPTTIAGGASACSTYCRSEAPESQCCSGRGRYNGFFFRGPDSCTCRFYECA